MKPILQYKSIFISDVHLGTKGCQAEKLLEFFKNTRSEKLYCVGDIIDVWALQKNFYWPQAHNDVIQKILRKARHGTEVFYVIGNHDEVFRKFIPMHFGQIKMINRVIHQSVQNKKYLVEGKRLIIEGLKAGVITNIYYSPEKCSFNNFSSLKPYINNKIEAKEIDEKTFNIFSNTITSQGLIGIALINNPKFENCIKTKFNWIYLDKIKDPGNLGTILRTAEWFGIKNIGLSPECVDPYNSKVVRSGMGAHFNLNIISNIPLNIIKDHNIRMLLADKLGEPISKSDSLNKWCLILGSEADGASSINHLIADKVITIQGKGKIESLNVAVSCGIIMNELTKNH